jgi:hypothetical protein
MPGVCHVPTEGKRLMSPPSGTIAGTRESAQVRWLPQVLLAIALLLLACLPMTWQHRTPGDVDGLWYVCAVVDTALLLATVYALLVTRHIRPGRRLQVYVVIAIGVCVSANLAETIVTQHQMDYWAHRGIRYPTQ